MFHEVLPRGSERYLLRAAMEQLHTKFRLEPSDLSAQYGWGDVFKFCGFSKVQRVTDSDDVLQLSQFHARLLWSLAPDLWGAVRST
jgi:predicted GNAT family N-acyltransferase